MKKTLLLLAAGLLLGTAALAGGAGAALLERSAGLEHGERGDRITAASGETFRIADRDHRREKDHAGASRHDDDEDDDDEGSATGARLPATGPTDPATPVPDNGLFQGKARPKVEVN